MLGKIYKTRFPELGYTRVSPTEWRIIDLDIQHHPPTGPRYRSKVELLTNLHRFAAEYGCTF